MDKHFLLYVLQLSNDKYYVHVDCDKHVDLQTIYLSAAIKSPIVRENMPVKQLIEKTSISNVSQVDAKVKEYMMKYGYDNVRGGSYSEKTLTSEQINVVQRELICASSLSFTNDIGIIHKFINEYSSQLLCMNTDERNLHIKTIQEQYQKFEKEKREYENLHQIMDEICVGEPLIKKLDFLKGQCQIIYKAYTCPMPPSPQHFMGHRESQIIIDIYRILCKKFKQLSQIFNITYPDANDKIDMILTKNPEFVLDDFIFHKHYVANKQRYDMVERLLNQYVFMCNKLINRLEEYKHSVMSWDTQLENKIILSKLLIRENS